ncbi:hypothetical protein AL539_08390 (plasmid) [Vibrio alginolyticus]|uniref:Uncharacterized protein n=2 Tax=Vibrio TaxID=662 RepID=A0AAX1G0I7_VIBPH|nr:hypothetical protein AL539_08390 [Vibrio alginolyticus]AWB03190.1 hypothetical protein CU052_28675 [Vibrio harveyi]QHH13135.1 hypothetical protein EHC69_28170 [Vibrio parahaemolyticus]QLK49924.1 hypothetical protein DR996_33635 [Vibrio owensii]RJX67263.1 hypothetical protein DZ860_18840 [Vibrio sinensis]
MISSIIVPFSVEECRLKKIKQHFLISSIYLAFKGLCCVIKFRDRATPFRVFLSQYDKFQAYLT